MTTTETPPRLLSTTDKSPLARAIREIEQQRQAGQRPCLTLREFDDLIAYREITDPAGTPDPAVEAGIERSTMSKQPVISTERRPSDIHKPELTCPKCGGKTIFFNCDESLSAFYCLSDMPMCNFYAEPDTDRFREEMKQLTGITLRDLDAGQLK